MVGENEVLNRLMSAGYNRFSLSRLLVQRNNFIRENKVITADRGQSTDTETSDE